MQLVNMSTKVASYEDGTVKILSSGSMSISRWYCIMASPFNRSWVMVLRKDILMSLSMLIDLLHSTGSVAMSFISVEMFGK